jgi:hypothetical protein
VDVPACAGTGQKLARPSADEFALVGPELEKQRDDGVAEWSWAASSGVGKSAECPGGLLIVL